MSKPHTSLFAVLQSEDGSGIGSLLDPKSGRSVSAGVPLQFGEWAQASGIATSKSRNSTMNVYSVPPYRAGRITSINLSSSPPSLVSDIDVNGHPGAVSCGAVHGCVGFSLGDFVSPPDPVSLVSIDPTSGKMTPNLSMKNYSGYSLSNCALDDARGLWYATLVVLPPTNTSNHTRSLTRRKRRTRKPVSDQQLVTVDLVRKRVISSVAVGRYFMGPLVVDDSGKLITTGSDRKDCYVAYVHPSTGKQRCLPVKELLQDATGFVSDYGAAAGDGLLFLSQIQPNPEPSLVGYFLVTVSLNEGAPKLLWNATLDQELVAMSVTQNEPPSFSLARHVK